MSHNIALIGMMGAGKSTVGRSLAGVLGRGFADTDHEIEVATRRSIPELFEEYGEQGFRQAEARVIQELSNHDDLVLGLGGGAVLDDGNVANLLLSGVLVMLDLPPEALVKRLSRTASRRPLLAGHDLEERVAELHAERDARYREVADVVVDGDKPVQAVVRDVLDWALERLDILTPSEHEQVMP